MSKSHAAFAPKKLPFIHFKTRKANSFTHLSVIFREIHFSTHFSELLKFGNLLS